MTREWKVGDRFSVEGVITAAPDCDGDYQAIFDGHTTGGCVLAAEMQHAKLIQPAAPEPQKLDVTKPICIRDAQLMVKFVERTESGRVIIELATGIQFPVEERQLENIPEPKIKGRREVVLLDSCAVTFADALSVAATKYIVGRAWVEIEAGDGMGEVE